MKQAPELKMSVSNNRRGSRGGAGLGRTWGTPAGRLQGDGGEPAEGRLVLRVTTRERLHNPAQQTAMLVRPSGSKLGWGGRSTLLREALGSHSRAQGPRCPLSPGGLAQSGCAAGREPGEGPAPEGGGGGGVQSRRWLSLHAAASATLATVPGAANYLSRPVRGTRREGEGGGLRAPWDGLPPVCARKQQVAQGVCTAS